MVEQCVLFVLEFFFEAESADGHSDFRGFAVFKDLIEALFVSGIVLEGFPIFYKISQKVSPQTMSPQKLKTFLPPEWNTIP